MKQRMKYWEKKRITKEGKEFIGMQKQKKERQNKEQLFLKWLSTKDNNDEVQYKMAQAKIRRMVTNHRNEFGDKKCFEIQSHLGSKKSSDSWKFIKNIRSSNKCKSHLNLISGDMWEK